MMRAQHECKCVCLLVMLAKGVEGTGIPYRTLAEDSPPLLTAMYIFSFFFVLPDTHVCSS
jgi:hypothetical protein